MLGLLCGNGGRNVRTVASVVLIINFSLLGEREMNFHQSLPVISRYKVAKCTILITFNHDYLTFKLKIANQTVIIFFKIFNR